MDSRQAAGAGRMVRMKIFIGRDHEDIEIVFADTIEEVRNQITARYDIAEIPLPPGVFLGQWHKISERMPERGKEVYFRQKLGDKWEYDLGYMNARDILWDDWVSFMHTTTVDGNDEWTEIPQ